MRFFVSFLSALQKSEQELLRALVSCLNTTSSLTDLYDCKDAGVRDGSSAPIFSDSWLYDDNTGDDIDILGSPRFSGCYPPHPALKVARTLAAFPLMPSDWDAIEARWEFMTAFPADVTAISQTSVDQMGGALRELDVVWSLGNLIDYGNC